MGRLRAPLTRQRQHPFKTLQRPRADALRVDAYRLDALRYFYADDFGTSPADSLEDRQSKFLEWAGSVRP